MAVLNRDDFFSRINEMVGSNTDDASIKFIEDMSDTYNDLEGKANSTEGDWERKYHELDNAWKTKYKQRFFSGTSRVIDDVDETEVRKDKNSFDDLFK